MGPESSEESVLIQLVDLALGRAVQTWTFQNMASITIGRSPHCQISLADPYVSRDHVELHWFANDWWIVGRGRNGVIIDGKRIIEQVISNGTSFRLGPEGPMFRFFHVIPEELGENTISFETAIPAALEFNPDRLDREVREFEENDYFKKLLARTQELRSQRVAPKGTD
ncbi:MAG: FHA domain-containing protein [Planctomycetota bacterium]